MESKVTIASLLEENERLKKLVKKLERQLADRAIFHKAKKYMTTMYGMDEESAHRAIQTASMSRRVSLGVVCQEVLDGVDPRRIGKKR